MYFIHKHTEAHVFAQVDPKYITELTTLLCDATQLQKLHLGLTSNARHVLDACVWTTATPLDALNHVKSSLRGDGLHEQAQLITPEQVQAYLKNKKRVIDGKPIASAADLRAHCQNENPFGSSNFFDVFRGLPAPDWNCLLSHTVAFDTTAAFLAHDAHCGPTTPLRTARFETHLAQLYGSAGYDNFQCIGAIGEAAVLLSKKVAYSTIIPFVRTCAARTPRGVAGEEWHIPLPVHIDGIFGVVENGTLVPVFARSFHTKDNKERATGIVIAVFLMISENATAFNACCLILETFIRRYIEPNARLGSICSDMASGFDGGLRGFSQLTNVERSHVFCVVHMAAALQKHSSKLNNAAIAPRTPAAVMAKFCYDLVGCVDHNLLGNAGDRRAMVTKYAFSAGFGGLLRKPISKRETTLLWLLLQDGCAELNMHPQLREYLLGNTAGNSIMSKALASLSHGAMNSVQSTF